jgi:Lon protease-like protein
MLEGVARVSMVEAPCDTPYRQVRIEPRPERPGSDDPSVLEQSKLELLGTLGILLNTANAKVPIVLNQAIPLEVLINKACAGLPIDASARQRLLAEDDLLGRQRRVSDHLAELIGSISQTGGVDPDGGSFLN